MRVVALFFWLCFVPTISAQQVADSAFTFPNPHPSFESGLGPKVCMDAAHNNFHTLDGRYFAFGKLLRGDGFSTVSVFEPFDGTVLADCGVLVIANALAPENAEDWGYPHPSAFDGPEIAALTEWVREGGSLLLVMDHAPMPAAVADLASLLGVVPLNGSVTTRAFGKLDEETINEGAVQSGRTPEEEKEALGTLGNLGDHPILQGRKEVDEPVRGIMTFGGSAFLPSARIQPLLQVPEGAYGLVRSGEIPEELWPQYSMDGWLVGGALDYGQGRVVILGEAAMCSAQLAGPDQDRFMGMNNPLSIDNPRFCLNAVRWLAGVI
jgi:hypothetical protein